MSRFSDKGKEVAHLKKTDFSGQINSLSKTVHRGTRSWILDDIERLLSSAESRGMMISARAGFGKSVIAAVTCQTMQQLDQLAACHFIEHNKPNLNTPKVIVGSLARHLCDTVPEFEDKLENISEFDLTKLNCRELFDLLLEQPLNAVKAPDENMLIVIDGLDEIDLSKKDEFIEALTAMIPRLPEWIKFVLTIRTQKRMVRKSGPLKDVTIEPDNPNNVKDIKTYLTNGLEKVYPLKNVEKAVNRLVELSGGLFLFAYFVVDFAASNKELEMSQLFERFPTGLSSVYEVYVQRLFDNYQGLVEGVDVKKEKFFDFLAAVVSSRGPLPEALLIQILGLNGKTRTLQKAARETLKCFTHLFPSEERHVSVFHGSLADWLIETEDNEHDFSVQIENGHSVLAALCHEYLQSVSSHSVFPPPVNDCEKYALRNGFHHMLEAGGYEEQLKEYVFNLRILSSKYSLEKDPWYGLEKSVLNEVTRIQKCFKWDFPELHQFIENMCSLKQKSFDQYPHAVLQAAVHFPTTSELRQQAVDLFGSPLFSGLVWVEFMGKEWFFPETRIRHFSVGTNVIGYLYQECLQKNLYCIGTINLQSGKSTEDISRFPVVYFLVISPDGKYLAVGTEFYVILLRGHPLHCETKLKRYGLKRPTCCCFLPDGGKLVIAIGWDDGSILVYNIDVENKKIKIIANETFLATSYLSVPMFLVSSSERVFVGSCGKFFVWKNAMRQRIFDEDAMGSMELAQSKPILLTDEMVSGESSAAAVSPDSMKVAVLCQPKGSSDRKLCVFNTANNKLITSLPVVFCLSILFLDNTRIIIGEYGELLVWSITSGDTHRLPCPGAWEMHCLARLSPVEFIAMLRSYKGSRGHSKFIRIALRNLKS